MKNKFSIFILILILSPLIGGIYGIIHDQLTYTISPEYYTKFKFYQFGFAVSGDEFIPDSPRLFVSGVGFLATWWVGLIIGIILGLVGFIHKDGKTMMNITIKAILLTIMIALIVGVTGLLYGKFHLAETGVRWNLRENLIDKENFIAVGSMHNFSYLGGLIGMIISIIFSVFQNNKIRKEQNTP